MSEQESLRIGAELVDNFSPNMRKLRTNMQEFAKAGAEHTQAVAAGFGRVEAGMKSAAGVASSALTPALATVGITGLSLTATIAGIGAAVRNFGSSAKALGTLSRDTGIGAATLREVQGVLGAVGVDAGTSGAALQRFADDARLAHRGIGDMILFLRKQGRDAEGRKYFNDLADSIVRSKDAGDAFQKALQGLEGIKDPIDRRIYAENVLKMADAARLADGRLGSLADQFARFRKNNGVVSEQDIRDAEAYARAMDGLKGTMERLYNSAAREVTPMLTGAATAIKSFLDEQRNGVQSTLIQTLKDIKTEVAQIDWKTAGKDGLEFLRETTALAGSLAGSLRTIVGLLHDLNKGDYVEALRKSTGGGGTVGRIINQLYPRAQNATPEGEALDAMMRGQTMTPEQLRGNQNLRAAGPRVAEIEARQADIARRLAQADLLEKGGTASDKSREAADALRREMAKLTDELRRIRDGSGTPTVQQQSFGGGTGLGGLIHAASYGGGGLGAVRSMLRSGGGIYAPGGAGAPTLPGSDSPAGRIGQRLRADGFGNGGVSANPGDYKEVLDYIAKNEGTADKPGGGYNTSLAVGRLLPGGKEQELTGKTLNEIDALQTGMLRHPGNRWNSSAIGRYQIVRTTLRGLRRKLGLSGNELYDASLQDRLGAELARARGPNASALHDEWASLTGQRGVRAAELMRRIRPGASTIPGEPGISDGAGFAAAYRARQAADEERGKSLELRGNARTALQNSLRAGAVGATESAERALLDVHIRNPGPTTRADVTTKGSLFREIRQSDGRQMRRADET